MTGAVLAFVLALAALGFAHRLARGPALPARLAGLCGLGLCAVLALAGFGAAGHRGALVEAGFALTLMMAITALAVMKLVRHRSLQIGLAPAPAEGAE
jgi:multisubunit Na+/H+ antiporter MnhF subunit